jgi:hypothetical protein
MSDNTHTLIDSYGMLVHVQAAPSCLYAGIFLYVEGRPFVYQNIFIKWIIVDLEFIIGIAVTDNVRYLGGSELLQA